MTSATQSRAGRIALKSAAAIQKFVRCVAARQSSPTVGAELCCLRYPLRAGLQLLRFHRVPASAQAILPSRPRHTGQLQRSGTIGDRRSATGHDPQLESRPMRRWLFIFLLLVLPFQMVWAAAAPYCAHEVNPSAKKHFGHHEHKHSAGDRKSVV